MIFKEMFDACRTQSKAGEDVYGFFGSFRFLSNFWPSEVYYKGLKFRSVEHAYQASKDFDNDSYVSYILEAPTPGKAKYAAKAINDKLPRTWRYDVGVKVMRHLVLQKFATDEELFTLLIATGKIQLIEANSWGDCFWGVIADNGEGDNNLGKILMDVRSMLRDVAMIEAGKMTPVAIEAGEKDPCPICGFDSSEHPFVKHEGCEFVRRCDQFVTLRPLLREEA